MLSLNNRIFPKYADAEKYLLEIPKFTSKNALRDTVCFLEVLHNPGSTRKIIHVAGTNGKGSVCAYLTSILSKAGYCAGMFSSPHLLEMSERFRIGRIPVEQTIFLKAFQTVYDSIETVRKIGGREDYHPSFFEYLFLMGMLIFEWEKTDYIILETGLGGRLDATNAVQSPILTVITEIGMDHMEYLGTTIAEIASEKAGIIKEGVPVVFCDKKKEASDVIRKRAQILKAKAFPVSEKDWSEIEVKKKNIDFSFHSRYDGYIRLSVAKALYQVENASIAVRCMEVLDPQHNISLQQLAEGIAETVWEGRMEEILPGVFIDGAHNEDGIRAFTQTVQADGCQGRRYLLFSVAADKDYRTMIPILEKDRLFSLTAAAQFNGGRAADLNTLEELFARYAKEECYFYEHVEEALHFLLGLKKKEDYIYIVGSLYLVGEIKGLLRRRTDD